MEETYKVGGIVVRDTLVAESSPRSNTVVVLDGEVSTVGVRTACLFELGVPRINEVLLGECGVVIVLVIGVGPILKEIMGKTFLGKRCEQGAFGTHLLRHRGKECSHRLGTIKATLIKSN